ncbi:hypothetical protein D3C76_725300 [compost metagenome]
MVGGQAGVVAGGDLQQHQRQVEGEAHVCGELRRVAGGVGFQPVFQVELGAAEGVHRKLGQRGEAGGDVAFEECGPVAGFRITCVVVLDMSREALAEQDQVGEVALVGEEVVGGEFGANAAVLGRAGADQGIPFRAGLGHGLNPRSGSRGRRS